MTSVKIILIQHLKMHRNSHLAIAISHKTVNLWKVGNKKCKRLTRTCQSVLAPMVKISIPRTKRIILVMVSPNVTMIRVQFT